MKVTHLLLVVAAAASVVALSLLAACGSSSPTSGGSATSVAASTTPSTAVAGSSTPVASGSPKSAVETSRTVVTRAQAGAALGQTVTPAVLGHATVEGGVAAVFYGPNAPAGASADVPVNDSVRVVLVTGTNALKYFDDYRSKVKAQALAGLGDKAYWDGYASLSVLKGDEYLRIAVIGAKSTLSAEKELAVAALPRM